MDTVKCSNPKGRIHAVVDILHHVNEMDSISFYKAKVSTSSRIPSSSCCRPPMRFAFTQANPACPAVSISHWFSRQLLVLNDICLKISLFNFKIFVPLYPVPEENGFYGQDDKKPPWISGGL